MGKPQKPGIDYASWNVNIFDGDEKIDRLIEAQGWNGFSIYFFLCQRAYATDGYFYRWSYDNAATTARKMGGGIKSETVKQTVASCCQIGLFDKGLFDQEGVLTSKGIQRTYGKAIQRRRRKSVNETFWLLPKDETEEYEITFNDSDSPREKRYVEKQLRYADKCQRDADKCQRDADSPKSKVKKSKVKESKEEKDNSAPQQRRTTATGMIEAMGFNPDLEQAVKEWVKYKTEKRQSYRETGLKSLLTMVRNKAAKEGDASVIEAINLAMASNWQGFHFDNVGTRTKTDRIKNRVKEVDSWVL